MDALGCDYDCRTVGEGINKYSIPDDWTAEFDVYDGFYPIINIRTDQIRKRPAMMELKIRVVENEDEDEEYAGCMVLAEKKTVAFKVECMSDLVKAMEKAYPFKYKSAAWDEPYKIHCNDLD